MYIFYMCTFVNFHRTAPTMSSAPREDKEHNQLPVATLGIHPQP